MKVKELIEELKKVNQEKEVWYDSYCEMILEPIDGEVKEVIHYLDKSEVVTIG